ncbi:hypothetical protein [Sphingobacterium siyangense]|uniref:hypothetical protein n=1 Tax=Sphingobacterium siyangense TaxID=459529 RepID=UPI003DA55F46
MNKKEKFEKNLIELSLSNDYEVAKKEWDIISVKEKDGKCICTQQLTYSITLKNTINGNEITVGADCLNKFISNNLGINIIKCFNKIIRNNYSLLSEKVLYYLFENEIITKEEYDDYDINDKKKKWNVIKDVNEKFLLSLTGGDMF